MTQQYLGQKIVTAWESEKEGVAGYSVKYEDGYISWCPKDSFEKANIVLGHIDGLPEYQQRVIAEKVALEDKISKLKLFVSNPRFSDLSRDEQTLLFQQLAAMNNYAAILDIRIQLFGETA